MLRTIMLRMNKARVIDTHSHSLTGGHVDLVYAECCVTYNQIAVDIQPHAEWSATSRFIVISTSHTYIHYTQYSQ